MDETSELRLGFTRVFDEFGSASSQNEKGRKGELDEEGKEEEVSSSSSQKGRRD